MIPGVRNLARPPSWKVERIWEWVTRDAPSWKIPRIHLSEFRLNERYKRVLCCFLSKNVVFMPISALSLNFYNIRYFSFNFEKTRSFKSSIRSKFTSYLHAFTSFRLAKVFDIRYVYRFASILQMDLSYDHQLNESSICTIPGVTFKWIKKPGQISPNNDKWCF